MHIEELVEKLFQSEGTLEKIKLLLEDSTYLIDFQEIEIPNQTLSTFVDRYSGLITGTGCLKHYVGDDRTRALLTMVLCERESEIRSLKSAFRPYQKTDPVFTKFPELWELVRHHDDAKCIQELISIEKFITDPQSLMYPIYKHHFLEIDSHLGERCFSDLQDLFKGYQMYYRIHPDRVRQTRPATPIVEYVLRPAHRTILETLALYPKQVTAASYHLLPEENQWEYAIGLRSLDLIVTRNNSGNLSFTIEELQVEGDDVLGRMIHLDTDAPSGTDFDSARMNHLDLAINVYADNVGNERLEHKLTVGEKLPNASYRTHLFRVENAQMSTLPFVCNSFFLSTTLKTQWQEEQSQFSLIRKPHSDNE